MARDPIDYSQYDAGRHLNYWELDRTMRFEAARIYPDEEFEWAAPHLSEFGAIVGHTIADNADVIDRHGHELHTYDKHGEITNHVEYHPLQHENDELAYENGIVSDAFHAPTGRDEPLGLQHTLTMQNVLSYADSGFVCPVSMTTGAALVLDRFGTDEFSETYFERLTARDAAEMFEGAMFLTEKQGGSDVGANQVRAEPTDEDRIYELSGEKWFCSNIDAEGTLALARRPDAPDGTDGLSLFIAPHTTRAGDLNDQLYRRLKDKLGTISVPTGEVEFDGAEAYLVGDAENGFEYMTAMLNFERLTNAGGSLGIMGRSLLESKIHAANREVFGETIDQYPLLRRDLVDMQVDYDAGSAFVYEAMQFYDDVQRVESERIAGEDAEPRDSDHDRSYRLMRLLVPIAKYKLGRMCVDTASYAMEILGGNGYVEDFVTPRLLRDAQVTPIWEGASNILSLDVLRVLSKEAAHEALFPLIREKLETAAHPRLTELAETVEAEVTDLEAAMVTLASEDSDYAQHEAKRLADYVFDVVTAAALIERAQERIDDANDGRRVLVAEWFLETRFGQAEARGITDGETLPDEYFDEIVRYGSIEREARTT